MEMLKLRRVCVWMLLHACEDQNIHVHYQSEDSCSSRRVWGWSCTKVQVRTGIRFKSCLEKVLTKIEVQTLHLGGISSLTVQQMVCVLLMRARCICVSSFMWSYAIGFTLSVFARVIASLNLLNLLFVLLILLFLSSLPARVVSLSLLVWWIHSLMVASWCQWFRFFLSSSFASFGFFLLR